MLQYFLRTRTLVFWGRRRFLTTPGIIVSIRAVDMDALWDLIYGPYSDFADCPRNVRYRKRNSQLMNHVQFSCPWIWTTPHLRSSFMMLTFFKRLLTRCFVERSSNRLSCVSSLWDSDDPFLEGISQKWHCKLLSASYQGHVSICCGLWCQFWDLD